MPYDYTLVATIPASAQEIYDAWLDSLAHSAMTGGPARMSAELGAEVSAWDGYITGRNLELVPGERIVQSWRTTKFPEDHPDSIITLTLEESDDGTLVTLAHSNVPEGHVGYEQGGWQQYYFEPMIAYFSGEGAMDDGMEGLAQPARPAARKKAAAARARPRRAAVRKKAATAKPKPKSKPKSKPKPAAGGKLPAAKKKAAAPKSRRAATAAKAKRPAARTRAKRGAKPARRR